VLEGFVDDSGQPWVRLALLGRQGQLFEFEAIIDTGFDGALCLPRPLAEQAVLQLVGTQRVELADGSQHVEQLFLGEVLFDGVRQGVDISLTQGADALLGTALLQEYQLEVRFRSRTVVLRKETEP
jgi:clan AA aspartic protease